MKKDMSGGGGQGEDTKKENQSDVDLAELGQKVQLRDLKERCAQLEQQLQQQQKDAEQARRLIQDCKEYKAEAEALRTQLEATEKAQRGRSGGMQGEVRNLQDQLKELRSVNKKLRVDLEDQKQKVVEKENEVADVRNQKLGDEAGKLFAENQKLLAEMEQVRQENKQIPTLIAKLSKAESQLEEAMDQDDTFSQTSSGAASVSVSRKREDMENARSLESSLRKEKKEKSDLQRELDDLKHELKLIKDKASHQQLFREISTLRQNLRESESLQAEFRKENMALKKSVADLSIKSSNQKSSNVSTAVPPQAASAIAGQHNEAKVAALTNENEEIRLKLRQLSQQLIQAQQVQTKAQFPVEAGSPTVLQREVSTISSSSTHSDIERQYSSRLENVENQLNVAVDSHRKLADENSSLKKQLSRVQSSSKIDASGEEKIQQLQRQLIAARGEIKAVTQQKELLQRFNNSLSKNLEPGQSQGGSGGKVNMEVIMMKGELDSRSRKIDELKIEIIETATKIRRIEKDNLGLQQQIDKLNGELHDSEDKQVEYKRMIEDLQQELEKVKFAAGSKQTVSQQQQELENLRQQNLQLQQQVEQQGGTLRINNRTVSAKKFLEEHKALSTQYDQIQTQLQQSHDTISSQEQELQELQLKNVELSSKVNTLAKQLDEVSDKSQASSNLEESLQQKSEEVKEQRKMIKELTMSLKQKDQETGDLQRMFEEAASSHEMHKKMVAELEAQLNAKRQEVDELERQASASDEHEAKVRELQSQLSSKHIEMDSMQSQIQDAEQLQQRTAELEVQLQKKQEEVEQLEQQVQEAQKCQVQEGEMKSLQDELNSLREQNQQQQDELYQQWQDKQKILASHRKAEFDLLNLQRKILDLEELQHSAESTAEELYRTQNNLEQLQAEKQQLEAELDIVVSQSQTSRQSNDEEFESLHHKIESLQNQVYELQVNREIQALTNENDGLKKQVDLLKGEAAKFHESYEQLPAVQWKLEQALQELEHLQGSHDEAVEQVKAVTQLKEAVLMNQNALCQSITDFCIYMEAANIGNKVYREEESGTVLTDPKSAISSLRSLYECYKENIKKQQEAVRLLQDAEKKVQEYEEKESQYSDVSDKLSSTQQQLNFAQQQIVDLKQQLEGVASTKITGEEKLANALSQLGKLQEEITVLSVQKSETQTKLESEQRELTLQLAQIKTMSEQIDQYKTDLRNISSEHSEAKLEIERLRALDLGWREKQEMLREELDKAQITVDKVREEMEAAKERARVLEVEKNQTLQQLDLESQTIQSLKDKIEELGQQYSEVKVTKDYLEHHHVELKRQNTEISRASETELSNAKSEIQRLLQSQAELFGKSETLQQDLTKSAEDIEKLRSQLQASSICIQNLENEKSLLIQQLEQVTQSGENTKEDLQQLTLQLSQMQSAQSQLETQSTELKNTQNQLSQAHLEIERLRAHFDGQKDKQDLLQQELEKAQGSNEKLRQDTDTVKERVRNLEGEKDQLQANLESVRLSEEKLQQKLMNTTGQLQQVTNLKEKLQEEVESLQKAAEVLEQAKTLAQQQLQQQSDEGSKQSSEYTTQISELQEKIEQLREVNKKKHSETDSLQIELTSFKEKHAESQREVLAHQSTINRNNESIASLQAKLAAVSEICEDLKGVKEQFPIITQQNTKLQTENEKLQEYGQKLEAEKENLSHQLELFIKDQKHNSELQKDVESLTVKLQTAEDRLKEVKGLHPRLVQLEEQRDQFMHEAHNARDTIHKTELTLRELEDDCRRLEAEAERERQVAQKISSDWQAKLEGLHKLRRESWPLAIQQLVEQKELEVGSTARDAALMEVETLRSHYELDIQELQEAKDDAESKFRMMQSSHKETKIRLERLEEELVAREKVLMERLSDVDNISQERLKQIETLQKQLSGNLNEISRGQDLNSPGMQQQIDKLRHELSSVKLRARSLMEEKDEEIAKLQRQLKNRDPLESEPLESTAESRPTTMEFTPYVPRSSGVLQDATVALNAFMGVQAQPNSQNNEQNGGTSFDGSALDYWRDLVSKMSEERKLLLESIETLKRELTDNERSHDLRTLQEQVLKDELAELQRSKQRSEVDVDYLKNVMVTAINAGELIALDSMIPVLETIFSLNGDEVSKIKIPKVKHQVIKMQQPLFSRQGSGNGSPKAVR